LAIVIVFTALSLVLEPIRIPVLFWPGQYFRITELPIVIVYFLFGFKAGFSVALLNTIGHITIFPEATGILALPWFLAVVLSLFIGFEIATRVVNRTLDRAHLQENRKRKPVFYFTTFGILTRVTIMFFVDYGMYRFFLPLVIGRTLSDIYIFGLMPAMIIFNIIVPLILVPTAYFTAKVICTNMGIGNEMR